MVILDLAKRSFRLFFVLLCGLALDHCAFAQFTTATLNGTVVDQAGVPVPGTKVAVQNVETGFSQESISNDSGEYLFSRLPVGSYKLTAEKTGFATYVQTGIQLSVDQAVTERIVLSLQSVSQQVTVSADASIVGSSAACSGCYFLTSLSAGSGALFSRACWIVFANPKPPRDEIACAN